MTFSLPFNSRVLASLEIVGILYKSRLIPSGPPLEMMTDTISHSEKASALESRRSICSQYQSLQRGHGRVRVQLAMKHRNGQYLYEYNGS